jgi:hypothetical protein
MLHVLLCPERGFNIFENLVQKMASKPRGASDWRIMTEWVSDRGARFTHDNYMNAISFQFARSCGGLNCHI